MKTAKLAVAGALALAVTSVSFTGCKKDEESPTQTALMDINYPAAFVANGASHNLQVINLLTNESTGTIDLRGAKYPHHVYQSPDKSLLAVAITATDLSGGHGGHGSGSANFKVLIVSSKTGAIVKELLLPKMPHNAAFNKTGSELWLGQQDEMQSQVLVYSTENWALQHTLNVGKGLSEVTFSHDGTHAFATNTDDATVTVINQASKAVIATVPVGEDPVGAWPATNGFVYADNEHSQSVTEINDQTFEVTATIPLGFKPGYVAYNKHLQELWVSDATNGKVVFYKKQNGAWTAEGSIVTGADAHAIAFAADWASAYVTNQGTNTVSVINTNTKTVVKTITVGAKPNGINLLQ